MFDSMFDRCSYDDDGDDDGDDDVYEHGVTTIMFSRTAPLIM